MKKTIPTIHASRTGKGARAIVLELMGAKSDPIDEATQKIFDDGNKFEETAIKQALGNDVKYSRGYEEKNVYMRFLVKLKSGVEFYISCSTDARLEESFNDEGEIYPKGTTIEVKNISFKSFARQYNQKRLSPGYITQVQTYLWAHKKSQEGKLFHIEEDKKGNVVIEEKMKPMPYEKALFITRCKSNRQIRTFPVNYNEQIIKNIMATCAEAIRHFNAGTLPECDCSHKFCRYRVACKGEDKKVQKELDTNYHFNVAGVNFTQDTLKYLYGLERPERNMQVILEPDPKNPYDANAVKVLVEGDHIGFVPKDYTGHVKDLLDDDFKPMLFRLGEYKKKIHATIALWKDS